ncbi:hypothetical protein JTB14_005507 [Gonioctena quinquepunctata]|nr:hypothetical protein JTB14_005507 [Gonioctena quinquepunctata]
MVWTPRQSERHKYNYSGKKDSILDGQGALYWDGLGDKGRKKPQFMKIEADGGSSDGLTISGWDIDVSAANKNNLAHNTDGFDVSAANNLIIENSRIVNQDDCVAIRYGSNITVRNLYCSGGHGLSLSVGFNKTSFPENVVSNVLIEDCTVVKSANAIHIKTHTDGYFGEIRNVTYRNIDVIGATIFGIHIQQDYRNGGGSGHAKSNVPIKDLTMSNIHGTMNGKKTIAVRVFCGDNGCFDWGWSSIGIENAGKADSCNYLPAGYSC